MHSTMTSEEIACHLHHIGTSFPLVQLCDTANASNTKICWSAEELHCIMSCCKFRITNIFCKSVKMDNGLMAASFPSPLALMQQFQKPNEVASLIIQNTITSMPCTRTFVRRLCHCWRLLLFSHPCQPRHPLQLYFWPDISLLRGHHLCALPFLSCSWVVGVLLLLKM